MTSRYDTKAYRKKKKLLQKLNKLKQQSEVLEIKKQIKDEKRKLKPRIQFTKKVVCVAIIIMLCILVFVGYEMHRLCNLEPAVALVGISATLMTTLLGYFSKSFFETKEEKKNELEREMFYYSNPHDEGGNG